MLLHVLMLGAALLLACGVACAGEFHVSPGGGDRRAGSKAEPFATLDRARAAVRELKKTGGVTTGGVTVWVHAGTYSLAKSFRLTKEDSGTAEAPVVYRAWRGEQVRITGAVEIPPAAFTAVTDPAIRKRIPRGARTKVLAADLKALGVTDFGDPAAAGKRPEVFFTDVPMMLARWPNEGFTTVRELVGGKPTTSHGLKGDLVGKFTYTGDRPARWAGETATMRLHGYWFWDWSDAYEKVKSIDTEKRIIATVPPYHHYGYRAGQRYYALNLLAELDSPGEWYLDRKTGMLYLWPPGPIAGARVALSVLEQPLVAMKDASHVVLRGLTLEATRGPAVEIAGGAGNLVAGCTIRNTGAHGVAVQSGTGSGVTACEIYRTGSHGVSISGGDRRTLTPAGNFATNNHIHHFARLKRTYAGAIHLHGVGNRAANNHIHDAPHWAVGFGGNDNVMERNEIHDVCRETGDVGVFYTGRDWTVRGNVIRHNFIHHVHGPGKWGAQGIYLDDAASGTIVRGNVIVDVERAMLIGGGRDNRIENNVIIDCEQSIRIDQRGLGWMHATVAPGGVMRKRLAAMPYKTPPWSDRYPELVSILKENPAAPKGNVVRLNVIVKSGAMNVAEQARALGTITDNMTTKGNPGFVDAAKMDFRLKPGSIVFKKLPGFQKIPLEQIGLRRDKYRTALPAESQRSKR